MKKKKNPDSILKNEETKSLNEPESERIEENP
jgi:hypothetical protein